MPQQLKVLKLELVKIIGFDSLEQMIPKLEELELISVKGFTDEMLIDILNGNPQLKSLRIEDCHRVSSSILQDIGKRIPNLKSLNVAFLCSLENIEDMLYISELRLLNRLILKNTTFSIKPLINALAKNEVPIKEFRFEGYANGLAESIVKLNKIENLHIGNISERLLIHLVKELKNLEKLRVACNDITPWGLLKILEHGKRLTDLLVIVAFEMEINLDIFNSILSFAKDRIHVRLMIRSKKIKEKLNFLNTNRKWLNISYI